ncbi:MAG: Homogentisate 1,2-dioxygenase [Phycisphaerae bacterium]|nr:Homogentisate 1,2-dioxygenase [Phycisphaerae bacterium]
MIHRHTLGKIPPKPHIVFKDERGNLLMEHCLTREGFDGTFTILYYRTPPTDETAVERFSIPGFCPCEAVEGLPLLRRHVRTQDLRVSGDFLDSRRTLFVNSDLHVGMLKPTQAGTRFFSNGDGDECYYAYRGGGVVESLMGVLHYREGDYVNIPRNVPYRLVPDSPAAELMVFEGRGFVDIPKQFRNRAGQLTMDAPYSHRDFRVPSELLSYSESRHGKAPFRLVVKKDDVLTTHEHAHFPYEVAGWDGFVYPCAFSIHDYQPKTGLIHLPPTIHLTFAGNGFVICSFVPRILDYHENAIPCPYGHASVHCDEIILYVAGNFTSRRGIGGGSISVHPAGVPHGPHPGAYEGSIGVKRTDELAVMCDTFKPLKLTKVAQQLEDGDYHTTWVKQPKQKLPEAHIP